MNKKKAPHISIAYKLNFSLYITLGGIVLILLTSYIKSSQIAKLHQQVIQLQETKIDVIKLNDTFFDIEKKFHALFNYGKKIEISTIINQNEDILKQYNGIEKSLKAQHSLKPYYKVVEYEPVIYTLRNQFYILTNLYKQKKIAEGKKLLNNKVSIWLMRITELVNEIQQISKEEIELVNQKVKDRTRLTTILYSILALTILLLIFIRNFLTIRSITTPIKKLVNMAQQVGHGNLGKTVVIDNNDEIGDLAETFNSMSQELKENEIEKKRTQNELVHLARQAGMSELATGVLHNVGNILSSVNVLTHQINNRIEHSSASQFAKIVPLIEANHGKLDDYLANDEKGKLVLPLLLALKEAQEKEAKSLKEETSKLKENIQDIIKIVSVQQSVAGIRCLIEEVDVYELIEQALQVNAAALERHKATVIKEYGPKNIIFSDRLKILQILINLISNAKYALVDADNKTVKISLTEISEEKIQIAVSDTGHGITAENMEKIFQYGFTTKADGHGFGLHHSILAAKDLGGELLAHSDGPGKGATFTLEIPKQLPKELAEKKSL